MSKTIGKILGILLSISIIATGICMMAQCLSIYNSSDKPYTREAVAQAFGEISVHVYVCLALMIVTLIYNFFVEGIYSNHSSSINLSFAIKAISRKIDVRKVDNEKIKKEHRIRKLHTAILSILLAAGFGCFFSYALNPRNFHQNEINDSMIKAMTFFVLCIIIPFVYSIICVIINDRSRQREIAFVREMIKDAPRKGSAEAKPKNNVSIIFKVSALIVCIAIIMYGLFSGGTADVLTKAINICTECIGLG